jgi:hypothetical protein
MAREAHVAEHTKLLESRVCRAVNCDGSLSVKRTGMISAIRCMPGIWDHEAGERACWPDAEESARALRGVCVPAARIDQAKPSCSRDEVNRRLVADAHEGHRRGEWTDAGDGAMIKRDQACLRR